MHGLPPDADLPFLLGAQLIQVCIGENETILRLHPDVSIMIASQVCASGEDGRVTTLDESRDGGAALLSVLGAQIIDAKLVPPGTLRLAWSSGVVVDVLDSWPDYGSYTIEHGDAVIVV